MTQSVQGIDVSHFQGRIDWAAVAQGGMKFAFIKATDGTAGDGTAGIDPLFRANWNQARDAGLKRGAYHFFRAQQDSERQARNFLAAIENDRGELPPVLDFELLGGASAQAAIAASRRWMEIVEKACQRKPMLYTGPAFWNTSLDSSSLLAEYPLWIAHYTTDTQPRVPSAWKQWTFWQYSEKGSVPGISGPVDRDCFNGTLMELDLCCARIQEKEEAMGA
jgi:lysozyme